MVRSTAVKKVLQMVGVRVLMWVVCLVVCLGTMLVDK